MTMWALGQASTEENHEHEPYALLVRAFCEHLVGRGLSPSTVRIRCQGLQAFGRYVHGKGIEDVRQMTKRELDGYVTHLRMRKLSPRTIQCWIATLKRFFAFLVDTNRLLLSPVEHLRERNLSHLVGPTLSITQAERLLAVPNTSLPIGVRDRALLEVLYGTGLRRAELATLTIFDVDLAGGLLRVSQAKGGTERIVPLGREALRWLGAYLEKVRPALARLSRGRDGEHRLWLGRDGRVVNPEALAAVVTKTARAAGIRASCHMLRRTVGTEMLRGGAQLPEVAALLGHRHLQTTQRYTKVVARDLKRVHAHHHPRGK